MFSKQSRYRLVPDVTVLDARGRLVLAKDIRPRPDVTGTYQHTVGSGDRLDQLGWAYYGQPLQYWRICDANPAFLSPLALLGQDALVTTSFPVTPAGAQVPWSALLQALSAQVGVDSVTVAQDVTLVQQLAKADDGTDVPFWTERLSWSVVVTYNRVNVDAAALAAMIAGAGFTVGPPSECGQVGRPITIPVAAAG